MINQTTDREDFYRLEIIKAATSMKLIGERRVRLELVYRCTALGTLANVIETDFWLSPAVKAAAIQSIDRRLGEME